MVMMYVWPIAYNDRSINDTQENFYLLKKITQAFDVTNKSEGRKVSFIIEVNHESYRDVIRSICWISLYNITLKYDIVTVAGLKFETHFVLTHSELVSRDVGTVPEMTHWNDLMPTAYNGWSINGTQEKF